VSQSPAIYPSSNHATYKAPAWRRPVLKAEPVAVRLAVPIYASFILVHYEHARAGAETNLLRWPDMQGNRDTLTAPGPARAAPAPSSATASATLTVAA
jgi:hypothetical protein